MSIQLSYSGVVLLKKAGLWMYMVDPMVLHSQFLCMSYLYIYTTTIMYIGYKILIIVVIVNLSELFECI